MNDKNMARALRYATIKGENLAGNLSDIEAKELLAGPLTPGDQNTFVDDSALLDKTQEEVNFILDSAPPSDVIGYALEWFQQQKPQDRSELARKFAIVITDLEKIYAYAKMNLD